MALSVILFVLKSGIAGEDVPRESLAGGPRVGLLLRQMFRGGYIANEGFNKETAEQAIESAAAAAVNWGQLLIANPDLPRRLQLNGPLNEPNAATFYAPGPIGYTAYPALEALQKIAVAG